jgi:hypothetical protein
LCILSIVCTSKLSGTWNMDPMKFYPCWKNRNFHTYSDLNHIGLDEISHVSVMWLMYHGPIYETFCRIILFFDDYFCLRGKKQIWRTVNFQLVPFMLVDGYCDFASSGNTWCTWHPTFYFWWYQFKAQQRWQPPPNGIKISLM